MYVIEQFDIFLYLRLPTFFFVFPVLDYKNNLALNVGFYYGDKEVLVFETHLDERLLYQTQDDSLQGPFNLIISVSSSHSSKVLVDWPKTCWGTILTGDTTFLHCCNRD